MPGRVSPVHPQSMTPQAGVIGASVLRLRDAGTGAA